MDGRSRPAQGGSTAIHKWLAGGGTLARDNELDMYLSLVSGFYVRCPPTSALYTEYTLTSSIYPDVLSTRPDPDILLRKDIHPSLILAT